MQFKVPQKIDMEDKIIGPLTMKQFVYLMVGGMILYATIKSYNVMLIAFLGVPAGLLALCLTFIKVQDQPFSKFMLSFISYSYKPKKRLWQKDWQKEGEASIIKKDVVKAPPVDLHKNIQKEELQRLSGVLDTKKSVPATKIIVK